MGHLSIIVPTFNEAEAISGCLAGLQQLRKNGHEIILVDGGSEDNTRDIARPLVDRLVETGKGRGRQLNAGAAQATGALLVFLHADTQLSLPALQQLENLSRRGPCWGRFDVEINGDHRLLRVIAFFMNLRSRLTGIATGDQVMFVHRSLFNHAGGYPDIVLMEDISLSSRLKKRCRPLCLRQKVCTSGRRWEKQGVIRTVIRMLLLRLCFTLGAPAERLARKYE